MNTFIIVCDSSTNEFYDLQNDSLMNINQSTMEHMHHSLRTYREKLDSLRLVYTDTKPDTTVQCQLESVVITGMETPEELPAHLIVSPNPGNGVFQLGLTYDYSGPITIEIMNETGAVYYKRQLNGYEYGYIPIDISNAPNGMYAIRISGGTVSQAITYLKVE